MLQKREALKGKSQTRFISNVDHTTTDDTSMGFTFISVNNSGERYDWGSGEMYEELLDPNGAKTHRLKTMFKDHDRSVDSAVGKVSNVRVEDGTLKGDVFFGSGEGEQSVYRKYKEGIIDSVSIGYQINDYKVETREGTMDLVTVTDYDVFEVSSVGLPFDGDATIDRTVVLEDESEVLARVEKLEAFYGITHKE